MTVSKGPEFESWHQSHVNYTTLDFITSELKFTWPQNEEILEMGKYKQMWKEFEILTQDAITSTPPPPNSS